MEPVEREEQKNKKNIVGPSAQLELHATSDAILGKVDAGVWKVLESFFGKVWKIPPILHESWFFVGRIGIWQKSFKTELTDIGFQGNSGDYFHFADKHQKTIATIGLLKWQ